MPGIVNNRPCLDCGNPSPSTRCMDCQRNHERARPRHDKQHHHHGSNTRWQRHSRRLRRRQKFCTFCGATEDQTLDLIIPATERPDLVFVDENAQVLCRSCNGRKGNRPPTPEERAQVEARLAARKKRRRYA